MEKKVFFSKMETMQSDLNAMRIALDFYISQMLEDSGKESIAFDNAEERPIVDFEGENVEIVQLLDKHTVLGEGENGAEYHLELSELELEDVKLIAEELARIVL